MHNLHDESNLQALLRADSDGAPSARLDAHLSTYALARRRALALVRTQVACLCETSGGSQAGTVGARNLEAAALEAAALEAATLEASSGLCESAGRMEAGGLGRALESGARTSLRFFLGDFNFRLDLASVVRRFCGEVVVLEKRFVCLFLNVSHPFLPDLKK